MQLGSLPAEIGQLTRLRVLFAYRNQLTELPEELGACTQLEVQQTLPPHLPNNNVRVLQSELCCASGAEFGEQPAFVVAGLAVQPDPAEEAQPQSQPHLSHPGLRLQHEGSGTSVHTPPHICQSVTSSLPVGFPPPGL